VSIQIKITILFFFLLNGVIKAQEDTLVVVDTAKVFLSLEEALQQPGQVYKLTLSKQKLQAFPKEIFQLTNLRELDLTRNKIKDVPKEIVQLQHLEKLNLSSNKLENFPEEFCSLTLLTFLSLNRNLIEKIPPCISNLQNLQTLELWDNELSEIPDEIGMLNKLQVLELRGILFSEEEQLRVKGLLPKAQVYFSPSCNCKY